MRFGGMRILILSILLISCSAGRREAGNLSPAQSEFLKQINKVRSKGCKCGKTKMPPVPPLSWNHMLALSAEKHARDMAVNGYFNHVSKTGKTIKNRIEEAGYTLTGMRTYAIGENIAAGQPSISNVMDGWLKSEGHCKNIMSSTFKEVGVAEYKRYWVQDFGMRVSR